MIETAITISLIVFFIHATSWEGHINDWVRKFIDPEHPISKPIYNCPICMTPWYGTIILLIMQHEYSLTQCILILGAASGFSVVLALINMIEDNLSELSNTLHQNNKND